MKKLDERDYQLLDMLIEGSRGRLSHIAKKLRMHKNSVSYRIRRLEKIGVIRSFSFLPGYAAIGQDTFYVFFRLKIKRSQKEKIYSYLKSHPLAISVLRLSGKWDIMLELACQNIHHFNDTLAEVTGHLGENLTDYKTILLYRPYKVECAISFENETSHPFEQKITASAINELDKNMLALLNENSNISYNELADRTGKTADTMFYRIKKMKESGVIRKFVPILDMEKIGYQDYIILYKFIDVEKEKFEEIGKFIASNKNIRFGFRMAGELGIMLFCSFKTNRELGDFILNFGSLFGKMVKEQDVMIVSETMKVDFFPEGLHK